jgi:DNA-binding transcriptional LysR family regulator
VDDGVTTLNNMDLNLLRVFQAISDEQSLTLAGERLHLSQPAVSYALRRLRAIFNDPLFIRTKTGMQPTPTALELAKPISRALQAVQDALSYGEQFTPATSTRTFSLSMTDAAEMFFLPPLCEYMREHAPLARIHVEQVPKAAIEESLRTGQLDFAIGNLPLLKSATLHARLFKESYVCVTRKRSGLPARKVLSVDEFMALSHVQVRSAESSHHQLEDVFRENGIDRPIALDVPHFSVLPSILARSDLAVSLPLRIARLFNTAQQFSLYELPVKVPEAEVTLHWHQDFDGDAGNRWMRQAIVDLLQEYGRQA